MPESEAQARKLKFCNWLPTPLLVAILAWLAVSRLFHLPHPPVGSYIAILAFAAAVFTVLPPENKWAKAGWILVFGGFLVLEISTLYQQRAEDRDAEHDKTVREDNRFAGLLKAQQDSFAQVLRDNQAHFNDTLRRLERLGQLSTQSIYEMTGGDSWPEFDVVPNIPVGNPPTYDLNMWVIGDYPLHDLSVNLRSDSTNGLIANTQGTILRQGQSHSLYDINIPQPSIVFTGLQPSVGIRLGFGKYSISMFSRNGFVDETLELTPDGLEKIFIARPGKESKGVQSKTLLQETRPLTLPNN